MISKEKLQLTITDPDKLIFGSASKPVKCKRGFEIGGGKVYPEINFTLPTMIIEESTWNEVRSIYADITSEICKRAAELKVPALIIEFELLPPMTNNPEWGAEITKIISDNLEESYNKFGLRSALRVTPVDIRDTDRPPLMRSGQLTEKMFRTFELCSEAGADMLSIESTGGKEVHNEALLNADLTGIIFSLGILAVRDMKFLWKRIVDISEKYNVIPAGDTACGFANTAMILADKGMIPKTLAAVIRVASVVRSLQAYLVGAKGPSKDCAYEGPFIKAITGVPISMEGKTSACAHLSYLGNIASSTADLWSNESVQNIKLLSTYAPVVSLEQLIYDCRLMNLATKKGKDFSLQYRNIMVESDAGTDPQAYILKPEIVIELSKKIIEKDSPYEMTLAAVNETLKVLNSAVDKGEVKINETETRWLYMLSLQLDTIPQDEETMVEKMKTGVYAGNFLPEEYDLK